VPNAPAARCALGVVSMHTGIHSGGTRHSPRNGFTVYFALPGDEFLFATVTLRITGRARPVGPLSPPQGLASATDARTTRLRRTQQCRSSRAPLLTAHECDPPCDLMRTRHRRVHRIPAPRFVTIGRNAPLHRGGMRGKMFLICPTRQALIAAADWHDGQFAHGPHARIARRAIGQSAEHRLSILMRPSEGRCSMRRTRTRRLACIVSRSRECPVAVMSRR
jgi:hypothetical protein